MKKIIIFTLLIILLSSFKGKENENFIYEDISFVKLNKEIIQTEFANEELFIIKFYYSQCKSHIDLLEKTFAAYNNEHKDKKLILLGNLRWGSSKLQTKYLKDFTDEKTIYFIDQKTYPTKKLHKTYDSFFLSLSEDCYNLTSPNIYTIYNVNLQECSL